jgi:hypothetical protein
MGMDISKKAITVVLVREERLIIGSEEKCLQIVGFGVYHSYDTMVGANNEEIYFDNETHSLTTKNPF